MANVCRSPFVQLALQARLDTELGQGHGIEVQSRGVHAEDGEEMDPRMQALVAGAAGPTADTAALRAAAAAHRAHRLTGADIVAADLIVAAGREQRAAVTVLDHRALDRTFTLRQLAVLLGGVDPAGLPLDTGRRVAAVTLAAAAQRGRIPVADDEYDIDDPYGGSDEAYAAAAAQLTATLGALADVLGRRPRPLPGTSPPGVAARDPRAGRPGRPATRAARRGRRRGARQALLLAAAGALVLVLAATGWIGVRGWLAYRHLRQVQAAVPQLRAALEQGGTASTGGLIAGIGDQARAARGLTSDPLWRAAQHLPVVGGDLTVVSTVARVSDLLARTALPPVDMLATLLRSGGGSGRTAHDLQVLAGQQQALESAGHALAAAHSQLAALPTAGLIGPEAAAVRTLTLQVGQAAELAATAGTAARVLPVMFDPAAPKTYLLLFQNTAEARSAGGIAGAFAVVTADRGHLRLDHVGAGAAIPGFAEPVLDLGQPAYHLFFENLPTTYFLDTTQTPWFPDTARLASRMWQLRSGTRVDGVIATDPVMLSYLLAAVGPVAVPASPGLAAHQIQASTVVPFLLSSVYRILPDPHEQDAAFAATTGAVFRALSGGSGETVSLVRALEHGAGQHRLLVWTRDRSVTADLAGTDLSGIPSPGTPDQPTVGLYLNDATASKMSYYLRRSAAVSTGVVHAGYRSVDLRSTLSSTAPPSGLPRYVTGGGAFGIPDGSQRVLVYVVAPVGGALVSATVDGRATPMPTTFLHGRQTGAISVDLAPGSRHVVDVALLAPPGRQPARLMLQPMTFTSGS